MATVINNPPNNQPQVAVPANEGSGMGGVVLTIAIIAILFFLFMVYGLPAMRGGNSGANAPAPQQNNTMERDAGGSGTTIDVPDEIDVNVKGN